MIWVVGAAMTGMAFLLIGALIRNRELVGINKELLAKTAKRQRAPRTKADEYRKAIASAVLKYDELGDVDIPYSIVVAFEELRATVQRGILDAS